MLVDRRPRRLGAGTTSAGAREDRGHARGQLRLGRGREPRQERAHRARVEGRVEGEQGLEDRDTEGGFLPLVEQAAGQRVEGLDEPGRLELREGGRGGEPAGPGGRTGEDRAEGGNRAGVGTAGGGLDRAQRDGLARVAHELEDPWQGGPVGEALEHLQGGPSCLGARAGEERADRLDHAGAEEGEPGHRGVAVAGAGGREPAEQLVYAAGAGWYDRHG